MNNYTGWTYEYVDYPVSNDKLLLTLERVSKTTARKLFNEGVTIRLMPCNFVPYSGMSWVQPLRTSKHLNRVMGNWLQEESFTDIVANYEWYNCQYNETGLYAAYYVTTGIKLIEKGN